MRKFVIILSTALLAGGGIATAQPAPPAPVPAPAPARLTLDTPIAALMADPRAKALVTAAVGQDLSAHPDYDMFRDMSLRAVQPMSNGELTDAMLKQIEAGLAALP